MCFKLIDFKEYKIITTIFDYGNIEFYLVKEKKTKKEKMVFNFKQSSKFNDFSGVPMLKYWLKFNHPLFTLFFGYCFHDFNGEPSLMFFLHDLPFSGALEKILEDERNNKFIPNFTKTKKYIILLAISLGLKYSHSYGDLNCYLSMKNIHLDENFLPRMYKFFLIPDMIMEKVDPIYVAPEIKKGAKNSYSSDVYSFSMIAYELFTSQKPFINKERKRPDLSKIKIENIRNFLSKCWAENPNERPSFGQIFEILLKKEFKEFFNANEEEVLKFLDLYEDDLKNPNLFKPFDINAPIEDKNEDEILMRGLILHKNKCNENEVNRMFKLAADRGNSVSMFYYSEMLDKGEGVPIDKKESLRYLKMAVDAGNPEAMYKYALKYWIGDEVEVDQVKSLHYFQLAADKGQIESIVQVGNFYLEQNDIDKATHYLEMASENGNIDAMFSYGNLLCNHLNDNKKGSKYLKMAADNGSIIAMDTYATYLLDNENKKEEAATYLRKAIKFGSVSAMLNYGKMLFYGDGIKMDKRKGIEYIQKAADFGSVSAMESYVSCFVHHISENKNSDENLFNDNDVIRYQEMATKTEEPGTYLRYAELFRFGWLKTIDMEKTAYYMN